MSTHVLEIAEKIADRVGIIQKGKLIALESVSNLKSMTDSSNNLEDTFLDLTGGSRYSDLLKFL